MSPTHENISYSQKYFLSQVTQSWDTHSHLTCHNSTLHSYAPTQHTHLCRFKYHYDINDTLNTFPPPKILHMFATHWGQCLNVEMLKSYLPIRAAINSPRDINLFQLFSGWQNKHSIPVVEVVWNVSWARRQTYFRASSCTPLSHPAPQDYPNPYYSSRLLPTPPPHEAWKDYELWDCHFYFPRCLKWCKDCLVWNIYVNVSSVFIAVMATLKNIAAWKI